MPTRRLLEPFELANPPYAFALVTAYEIDAVTGQETGALIPLYDSLAGGGLVPNPFQLNSLGMTRRNIYYDRPHVLRGSAKGIPEGFETGVYDTYPEPSTLTGQPYLSAAEVGLAGTGADETFKLNQAIADLSQSGGGTIWVRTPLETGIRLDGAVQVRSGVSLIYGSSQRYGPLGRTVVRGEYQEVEAALLLLDGAIGDNVLTVDPDSVGGGALSSHFPVGCYVRVRGRMDSGGLALDTLMSKVTAVNDGTNKITLQDAPGVAFRRSYLDSPYFLANGLPDRAYVCRLLTAMLTSDYVAGPGRTLQAGAGVDQVVRGGWYILEDDKTGADLTAGSSATRIHREIVRVEDVQGNTVTLNRRPRRGFEVAFGARLTAIDPAVNAHVTGSLAVFTGSPLLTPVHTNEIFMGVDSDFQDCRVGNEDQFGSRGTCFRGTLSYNSGFRRVLARGAKFQEAGEGYAAAFYYCSECFISELDAEGMRHGLLYLSDSGSTGYDLRIKNSRFGNIDFHGCEERGTRLTKVQAEGGTCAVSYGHEETFAGSFDCLVEELDSDHPSGAHMEIIAPASRCGIADFRCTGGTNLAHGTDAPPTGAAGDALQSLDCYAVRGEARSITSDWCINMEGAFFDADKSRRAIARFRVEDVKWQFCGTKLYRFMQCVAPIILENKGYNPVAGDDNYLMRCVDTAGIICAMNNWISYISGFALQNCTNGRFDCNLAVNWTGGVEYNNNGGNAGTTGFTNTFSGFVKTSPFPTA